MKALCAQIDTDVYVYKEGIWKNKHLNFISS